MELLNKHETIRHCSEDKCPHNFENLEKMAGVLKDGFISRMDKVYALIYLLSLIIPKTLHHDLMGASPLDRTPFGGLAVNYLLFANYRFEIQSTREYRHSQENGSIGKTTVNVFT